MVKVVLDGSESEGFDDLIAGGPNGLALAEGGSVVVDGRFVVDGSGASILSFCPSSRGITVGGAA